MKKFIIALVFIVLMMLTAGFFMQRKNHPKAEFVIGLSVLMIVLLLIPSFLYYRYRNKNLSDYMLNDQKIKEFLNFLKNKK